MNAFIKAAARLGARVAKLCADYTLAVLCVLAGAFYLVIDVTKALAVAVLVGPKAPQ